MRFNPASDECLEVGGVDWSQVGQVIGQLTAAAVTVAQSAKRKDDESGSSQTFVPSSPPEATTTQPARSGRPVLWLLCGLTLALVPVGAFLLLSKVK